MGASHVDKDLLLKLLTELYWQNKRIASLERHAFGLVRDHGAGLKSIDEMVFGLTGEHLAEFKDVR